MPRSWDVVVVGLGAMGSAALYQLSKRHGRVLGIDSFEPPHERGSSHGETRITRRAIGEGMQFVPLALRSGEIWQSLERETGRSLYVPNGLLVFGREGKSRSDHGVADFLTSTRRAAAEFRIPHEILDHPELRRRFPQFGYVGDEVGYYEPGAGFLRPEACIDTQLACARRNGAELRLGKPVTGLEPAAGGDGVILHCNGQTVRASRVILTVGAWISRFLSPQQSRNLRVCRQTLHWFPIDADPAAYAPECCPVFIRLSDEENDMIYGFPALDGARGGMKVACEQLEVTCEPEEMERTVSASESAAVWRTVSQFLPLAMPPLKARACLYTLTPDFGFLIDRHPQYPQVILASACSGHGFKHSAAIGEILAELALENRSTLDISGFSFTRFSG